MYSKTVGIIFDPTKTKALSQNNMEALIEKTIESGITNFICSPSSLAEIAAAEKIINSQSPETPLRLECVIPFEDIAVAWDEETRDRFYSVMEKCSKETLLQTKYSDGYILNKHKYISSMSDIIITL